MKHPFWILNSFLLLLLLFAACFVFFSRKPLPRRESIEPEEYMQPLAEKTVQVNISKIYENDLFGTYKKELAPNEIAEPTLTLPEPPHAKSMVIPEPPMPQFLDPLAITLKGIIIVRNDTERNRAIIADDKTSSETTYKVGDTIEDAQLIRIFSNKIIFLRSNGQQEVLYLREQDAKLDPVYAVLDGWDSVIQTSDNQLFLINSSAFTARIKTLAQFIDMLKLTTAYKKGQALGARIGDLERGSLGSHLGLVAGDIITAINGTPTITSADRMTIYRSITQMETGDTITVALLRKKYPMQLTYTLKKFGKTPKEAAPMIQKFTEEEKMKAMQEKHKFAPTLKQMQKNEKDAMIEKGKRPSFNF
jgi:type II secretion system protein C